MTLLKTKRLILRQWQEEDLEPFAGLNADPRVMEYFSSTLTQEESAAALTLSRIHIQKHGWGKWAVALIETGEFLGRIGLEEIDFPASFAPNIELGYRLAFEHWGKGYATEGALACLKYGFETLNLKEIVSFTATLNIRSRAVMERIGMHRDSKDDFDYPKLHEGHKLRRHVLYRLDAQRWQGDTCI